MKQFVKLFNKVGGKAFFKQYLKAHVLLFAVFQILSQGFSRKSLELVRNSVNNRILRKLRKKYRKFIAEYIQNNDSSTLEQKRSDYIWICWFQGIENAPDVVKQCYESIKLNFAHKQIVLITDDNYKSYITFPDYIQDKIDRGLITRTHMSDLLRTELLIKYGGTWIDATVYCSGENVPEYMMDSDLFMFQMLKPGLDGQCCRISSWFITSCSNNPILLLTRALLYEYWKKNDSLIDYFLFHDMVELSIETYPEEWDKVIPFSNSVPHILLLRLFDEFDENTWNAVKQMTPIHKLTYKFDKENALKKDTYFDVIFTSKLN